MVFVSDFADGAVLLPVVALVALLLGVLGWWRGLLAWVGAVGCTTAMVGALKAGALLLQDGVAFSPSGHVAGGMVVYGGMAVLLLRGLVPPPVLALPPAAIAVLMGCSRFELLAHDVPEVLVGAVAGALGVAGLMVTAGPRPRSVAWPAVVVTACAALAFHGLHLHSEEALQYALAKR